jgi:hypothetical protein
MKTPQVQSRPTPFSALARAQVLHVIADALLLQPRRTRRVVALRIGLGGPPLSWAAIGRAIGRSPERARQIYLAAIRATRATIRHVHPGLGACMVLPHDFADKHKPWIVRTRFYAVHGTADLYPSTYERSIP